MPAAAAGSSRARVHRWTGASMGVETDRISDGVVVGVVPRASTRGAVSGITNTAGTMIRTSNSGQHERCYQTEAIGGQSTQERHCHGANHRGEEDVDTDCCSATLRRVLAQ